MLSTVNCTLYPIYAQAPIESGQDIGSSRLSPENPLYFLKPVREILEIKFAGTEKVRILKRLEFAERRLREVNSLIIAKREDLVAPNMEKFLLEINLLKPVPDVRLPLVSVSLGRYMEILVSLYNNTTDPKAKLGIRSIVYRVMDFNNSYYMNMDPGLAIKLFPLQSAKFATGCSLLASESLNTSLNESERQILKERGEKCKQALLILQ